MLTDHDKMKHLLVMAVIRNIVYGRVMIDKTFLQNQISMYIGSMLTFYN